MQEVQQLNQLEYRQDREHEQTGKGEGAKQWKKEHLDASKALSLPGFCLKRGGGAAREACGVCTNGTSGKRG